MGYNLNDRLQFLEQKTTIQENKNKIVLSEKQEKEKQKNFKNQLYLKAKMILFDTMQEKIKNDYILQDRLYQEKEKNIIIDEVLGKIQKIYKLSENTQEELNYYLYINYYSTASKVITVVKKEQNAILHEKNIKNARKIIEQSKTLQESENTKKEKQQKELAGFDIILTIIFLFYLIWIFTLIF